jgi:hypothetical protein
MVHKAPYRILPTRLHGMLDYPMGALLVASPWLFDFDRGGPGTCVPMALGIALLAYSAFTDYECGLVRRLSMPTHLGLDGLSGVFLAASPWVLGFEERVWAPHLVLGLLEIGIALVTRTRPATRRSRLSFGPISL